MPVLLEVQGEIGPGHYADLVKNVMIRRKQRSCPLLPSLQLIGAQKAGTSALADWLFEGRFRRPQVFDGEPDYYSKEVHFFDDGDRYDQGTEFYCKRFMPGGNAFDRSCTMDATPDTLPFADRVRATYEDIGGEQVQAVKIIVILRNPVFRELSLYNHLAFDCRRLGESERTDWHRQVLKQDGSIMSFEEFVFDQSIPALGRRNGPGNSTRHSLYAEHLEKWFKLFDREQILVLSYDELLSSLEMIQGRIQAFIGQKIPGRLKQSNRINSQYKVQFPSDEASRALNAIFYALNEDLYQLLEANPGPCMEQRPFPRF